MRIKVLNQSIMPALNEARIEWNEGEEDGLADSFADPAYVEKSRALITDALQNGRDVMQLPNGDVVVTEVKTVSHQYNWNANNGRFEKKNSAHTATKDLIEEVTSENVVENVTSIKQQQHVLEDA